MIQRIQTIWLLLAAICAFLTLKLSFYSGNKIIEGQKQFTHLTANDNMLLTILSVTVGVAALILIFLFKDRKMQMRLTVVDLLISLLNVYLYFVASQNFIEGRIDWSCIIVFAIPVFLFLAFRGIYKDQKLVKSVDRLR
jgi:hypothetical protein